MVDDRPLPRRRGDADRTFWRATADGRLRIQHCPDCEHAQFPPASWCRRCANPDLEWRDADGEGTVAAATVVRRATALPAFADDVPYVLAYVDLTEGVRVLTNVVDCDPEAVTVGLPVAVTFEELADDVALPQFRPREA